MLIRTQAEGQSERGFAVLIVIVLLSLMVAFVGANIAALYNLKREVKLTDHRQQRRWAELSSTNAVTLKQ